MVNDKDELDVDIDVTKQENTIAEDIELEDIEDRQADKLKKLRHKMEIIEEDKKQLLDDLQRARAEFLNARKRIEEDRVRDRLRAKREHMEALLPLCDSFHHAMQDPAWEKADGAWRKGIEGIQLQLNRILKESGVVVMNTDKETFNPIKHEAVSTQAVTDKNLDDSIVSVLQQGYEITLDGKTEVLRPARVTIGQYSE